MTAGPAGVVLRPISAASAQAVLGGSAPQDVRVAADYPTEFSAGITANAAAGSPLGPYYLHRVTDDVVVGEIGGGFVADATAEIGYAVVPSAWGNGYATDAVVALLTIAAAHPGIAYVIAHTPLDRPASGRVLAKAGFRLVGEIDDTHDGRPLRVKEWIVSARCTGRCGASGHIGRHTHPDPARRAPRATSSTSNRM